MIVLLISQIINSLQFLKRKPKLIDNNGEGEIVTKPLSRQTSVQSTKSNVSISTVTPTEVSDIQSSVIGEPLSSDNSMSRTSSIKRDSMKSQNSVSGIGDQEPLIEQSETTELLAEQ